MYHSTVPTYQTKYNKMRCMLKIYAKKDVMNSSKTSKNSRIGIAKSSFLHGLYLQNTKWGC